VIAAGLAQDIHLWLGDPSPPAPEIAPDICTAAEQERAKRFASPGDAMRYLQTRAVLRRLLAAYAGLPATAIEIGEGRDGKPFVANGAIAFNLSHSGATLAIAIRAGSDAEAGLGVDVQQVKAVDELALARSLFAESEIAMLEGLGKAARRAAFFRLWTCREAVLKASGLGMKGRGFDLRQDGQGQYAVHALSPVWASTALHEFEPKSDVFGALAWKQAGERATPRPQIRQFLI